MELDIPVTSDKRVFEEVSQLVNLIRYQLGDPNDFLSNICFRGGSLFAVVERERIRCDDENDLYRHTANFAWVLLETYFTGGVPELKSPIFYLVNCSRRWQFVANFIRGSETIPDEVDIHLQCLDCQDISIRADVTMDLQKGTDKIGEETASHVFFDAMVNKHVMFTGARKRTIPVDQAAEAESLADAFTVKGSLCFKNCCLERKSTTHMEPDFQTSFYS